MPQALHDLRRSITWRRVVLVQAVALFVDACAVLVYRMSPTDSLLSRLVVDETLAFSMVLAIAVGEQAVDRGTRPLAAYSLALATLAVVASVAQFSLRASLGLYTDTDRPGVPFAVRSTNMVASFCDTLIYGALLTFAYTDHRMTTRLSNRMRMLQLEHARAQQALARYALARLEADVAPVRLVEDVARLQQMFEAGDADAERQLDALTERLRHQLDRGSA